ncbi:hypothetical protein ABIE69_002817 [Rhodobacteraceae bacterium MBR-64]
MISRNLGHAFHGISGSLELLLQFVFLVVRDGKGMTDAAG